MHDGENTFASDPGAIFVLDATVIHHSRLVKADPPIMDGPTERNLFGMEVIPAWSACDLVWDISQYILDGVGTVLDSGILGQIWLRCQHVP